MVGMAYWMVQTLLRKLYVPVIVALALSATARGFAAEATTFTVTGPKSISFGTTSAKYTVTPNEVYTGSIMVYASNAYAIYIVPAAGGADTAQVNLNWKNSAAPQTFTIEQRDVWNPNAANLMHATLNFRSSTGLKDASPIEVTITPRPVDLARPYSEETYQQVSGKADIKIVGTWSTTGGASPKAIEASWRDGPFTTVWTNRSRSTGNAVPFAGALPAQRVGTGDLRIRWVDAPETMYTARNVTVGDLSTEPFAAPRPPQTFDVPYELPVGGKTWNIGTTAPGVGDAAAFQSALHDCALGDVIVLTAGATYTGFSRPTDNNGSANDLVGFRLEPKAGDGWVYIVTSDYEKLPAPGNRVAPANLPSMARITNVANPNGFSAVKSIGPAHHFRFVGIEFHAQDPVFNLVSLGDVGASWDVGIYDVSISPAKDTAQLPHDITFDRCLLHQTDPRGFLQAAILANGARIAVVDSYIAGCHAGSVESNCIFCWNGTGPLKIVNNYLEATASEIMLGANDPMVTSSDGQPYELVTSDVEICGNHFRKLAIHNPNEPTYDGNPFLTKNHFEIKSAQRVLLEGNAFEYCNGLGAGQKATAIVLTPRNSNGTAPYSVCQDVNFTNNIVRGTGQVLNITGPDVHNMWKYAGTRATRRIAITNNLFDSVGDFYKVPAAAGTDAQFVTANVSRRDDGGPIDWVVTHNTMLFGPNESDRKCEFDPATSVVTCPRHNLRNGQKIMLVGKLPQSTPQLDQRVTYWAQVVDANTFTVWTAVGNHGSNAYYDFPLVFSGQVKFATGTTGAYLRQRLSSYSFNWQCGAGPPMAGGVNVHLDDNIIELGREYGFIVEASVSGSPGMDVVLQNYTFQGNLLAGNHNGVEYAARGGTPNKNAPDITRVGFTDYLRRDYRLKADSPFKGAASDGTDPGVDLAALARAVRNAKTGQTAPAKP